MAVPKTGTPVAAPQNLSAPEPVPANVASPAKSSAKPADKFFTEKISQPTAKVAGFHKPDWSGVKMELDENGSQTLRMTVARGDTLTKIANRLGTDVNTMVETNSLENPDRLAIGQKLFVPTTFHVAQEGETFSSIASKTGIDGNELAAFNVAHSDAIEPGQEVYTPAVDSTPEQREIRKGLMNLMSDAAEADSQLLYGPGTLSATASGNYLGWGDGGESSSYLFSDDYRHVQKEEIATEELGNSPVESMRHQLVENALSSVGWQSYMAAKDQNPNVKEPEQTQQNGLTKFTIYDQANAPKYVFYDPNNDSFQAFNGNEEIAFQGRAGKPTEAVQDLASYLGLKLPVLGGLGGE